MKTKRILNKTLIEEKLVQSSLTFTDVAHQMMLITDEQEVDHKKLHAVKKWLSEYVSKNNHLPSKHFQQNGERIQALAKSLNLTAEDIIVDLDFQNRWYLDESELKATIENKITRSKKLRLTLHITIVGTEAVMECKDEAVYKWMTTLLERGVKVEYFYPDSISNEDRMLMFNLKNRFYEAGFENQTFFYLVNQEKEKVLPWKGQNILFSNLQGEIIEPFQLFICVEAALEDPQFLWIKQTNHGLNEYLERLKKSSNLFDGSGLYAPFDISKVGKAFEYLGFFKQQTNLNSFYSKIFPFVSNFSAVNMQIRKYLRPLLLERASQLANKYNRVFKVLYIGYGNGENTNELAASVYQTVMGEFSEQYYGVDILAIDAIAMIPKKLQSIKKQSLSIRFVPQTWLESLDDELAFDMIVCHHAIYYLETSYLNKLVAHLENKGQLFIILPSKTKGLISFVDKVILANRPRQNSPILFAEDVYDYFTQGQVSGVEIQTVTANEKNITTMTPMILNKLIQFYYGEGAAELLKSNISFSQFANEVPSAENMLVRFKRI